MPGLHAFNRRWGIGSDDLVFPVIGENCLRFAWLIAISVVFHINKDAFDCESGHILRIYFIGVITIISLSAFLNIIIIHFSMKGTITNVAPRRFIPVMLYIKLAILIPEALWVLLGTYWAFGKSYDCDRAVVWTVRGAVIFAWIAGFFFLVGILLVFDPVGAKKKQNRLARRMTQSAELVQSDAGVTARKVWEMRCRLLCCCVSFNQDNQTAFTDVSKLIADFFEDVDLVPTDIAAGLILIEQQQSCKERELKSVVIDTSKSDSTDTDGAAVSVMSPGDCPVPESWMSVKMMSHFMKYALGSYGWPFYVYNNLATGVCKLATKCRPSTSQYKVPRFLRLLTHRFQKKSYAPLSNGNPNIYKHGRWYEVLEDRDIESQETSLGCCCCMGSTSNVYFDNACECHTAAIRKVTGVADQDLIYVSFHNKFKEIPFYVAIDREHKSVVISIRGTLSLEDALVDMSAEGQSIDVEGVEDAYVHGAIMDCATYIKDRIDSLDLITKALNALPECSRLVVVGHSLGAGAAAILAVLLKPQHPNLICFAYSPPGGLMSPAVSCHIRSYVCSIVVGKDLIPRLGMPTMDDLKTKILKALDECKLPKYRILAKGCMRIACMCISSDSGLEVDTGTKREPLLEQGAGTNYTQTEEDRPDHRKRLKDALHDAMHGKPDNVQKWPLHPPGQILHVEEVLDSGTCGGTPEYCASWGHPDDFGEILISPNMVLDHFPDVVLHSLEQLNERKYIPTLRQKLAKTIAT